MWLVILSAVLLVSALWVLWERSALAACPVGVVVPGAYAGLVSSDELPSVGLGRDILEAIASEQTGASPEAGPAPPTLAETDGVRGGRSLGDALLPGGLAVGIGLADWMRVDQNVLDTVGQWTHTDLHNGFDLWRTLRAEDYKLGTQGFEVKLRGHVGEQEVHDQLSSWAGTDLSMPEASNYPASDLTLGGHEFNVKMGADSSAITEHLQAHPDIPVIVNADMQGLPADAFHVDLSQPLDPDLLADHSVVVADGLLLSDLQDQMADALGPVLESFDVTDLLDSAADLGVPVLGSAIRVVRSGMRERQLTAHHGDKRRAAANIASDVGIVGSAVAGGGVAGVGLGFLIDVATMGATAGLGTTVIGPAVGSAVGGFFGGKAATHKRAAPLREARSATGTATLAYDATVTKCLAAGNDIWTTEFVPAAEQRMREADTALCERMDWTVSHARMELDIIESDLHRLAKASVQSRLSEVREMRAPLAVLDRRRRRRWEDAAQAALKPEVSTEVRLDVLCAVRAGDAAVRALLLKISGRRAVVLGVAGEQTRRAELVSMAVRSEVQEDLRAQRADLEKDLRAKAHPAAVSVWSATERVRKELVYTGTKEVEWVNTNLPSVDRPKSPAP